MPASVELKIPANIGNLGSGFDCIGLTLRFYNRFLIEKSNSFQVVCTGEKIATDEKNLTYKSFLSGLEYLGLKPFPVKITAEANIPVGKGLGSSGTAVLAGVIGAFVLSGTSVSKKDVLKAAFPVERHLDNIASSLYGGFTICGKTESNIEIVSFAPPRCLKAIVLIPDIRFSTRQARKIIPEQISIADAIGNLSAVGFLCYGMNTGRKKYIRAGMRDKIHQPYRKSLFPYLYPLLAHAEDIGAAGACLSGAGPSVAFFAFNDYNKIKKSIEKKKEKLGIEGSVKIFVPGGKTSWKTFQ